MKFVTILILSAFLVAAPVLAQDTDEAVSTAESLRSQLQDVQAKEAALQARSKQLEEDMKPENIQRALAGVGSTRPEELRELRRNQLVRELAGVQAQLEILGKSRARLESAILDADTAAYHRSARPKPVEQMLMWQPVGSSRWLVGGVAIVIGILTLAVLFVMIRKQRRV